MKSSRAAVTGGLALALLLVAVAAVLAGGTQDPLPGEVQRLTPTDIRFFADPQTRSAAWVREHPRDPRAPLISGRIASQPQGVWFTGGGPGSVQAEVARTSADASLRGELPILVMYAIPHRDCSSESSGGASGLSAYRRWVDGFSRGLGSSPAWVILEPDSLMQVGCLTTGRRSARFRAVTYAARTLHAHNPSARIYYDAGNSSWNSADETASLLREAHVNNHGDGLALNVANFNDTDDEVRFGMEVIRSLRNPKLRLVVDTSRNGDGSLWRPATCDPPDSRLGTPPTSRTGNAWVDAFLWVKPPGQSDGCHAAPGAFLPGVAYRMAVRGSEGDQGPPYLPANWHQR